MSTTPTKNPAEEAAAAAQAAVEAAITAGKSFRLEAGAGAGKTYSLVEALKWLISSRGSKLLRSRQKVACITYTNVACEEIKDRTDSHPAVLASTIHAFCWSLIKDFQPYLKQKIASMPKWPEKLTEVGGSVGGRRIEYELGYRTVTDAHVTLGHNDVIELMAALLEEPKFREIFAARHPILFIDEYQDTNTKFADAIRRHFLDTGKGPIVGFFGDSWQKIYGDGCGVIDHPSITVIGKGSNFRSVPAIVDGLNKMRPELPQVVSDPTAKGWVGIYHCNEWSGARRSDGHWKGDLPPDVAHAHLETLRDKLVALGWDFGAEKTKILMLTHNGLAQEQGYGSFGEIFDAPESYTKKEDPYIAFLTDTVEPVCIAYEGNRFGEMFSALDVRTPSIRNHADKKAWAADMDKLITLRTSGTIGEVIAHLKQTGRPRLPERLERREREFEKYMENTPADLDPKLERRKRLGTVAYREVIALDRFIDDKTPFSTKHGVKGAEFENVLVVIGRGWNFYDFNQMLEWVRNGIPKGKEPTFERNRNLFYVACSRPKVRLAVFFTQILSEAAMATLRDWFPDASIGSLKSTR